MPVTYEPIATTTLSSAAANIEFTSIGSGYTDLRLVIVGSGPQAGDPLLRYNGISTTTYSSTELYGSGVSATSQRYTSATSISCGYIAENIIGLWEIDIFSYAGSTNKTCLISGSRDANGSGYVGRVVGLWRSTSAITSVRILGPGSGNWATGTIATLYGILKA